MFLRICAASSRLLGPWFPKKVYEPLYSVAEGRDWK